MKETQTEKQKYSKSPLYGYRKPEREEIGGPLWCRCTVPTLTNTLGVGCGSAYCFEMWTELVQIIFKIILKNSCRIQIFFLYLYK